MRIAFYAPLKEPDHPVPSGDREMARLAVCAMRAGGHDVELVSTLRSFVSRPEPAQQAGIEAAARREIAKIADEWTRDAARRPDLWFTYHPFYKAPDLIGPDLAHRFGLPYATLEASHAGKRAIGAWGDWHRRNEDAIRAGAVHFCLTARDRAGIETMLGSNGRIVALQPFIDAAPAPARPPWQGPVVELVCVAMMRPGDKQQSYAVLAQALHRLSNALPWHLTVVGDGPARAAVELAFGHVPAGRITWRGELQAPDVAAVLRAADLLVWPGCNEAYGIAYLEAAARGVPALAFDSGGISSVVSHGSTGLLVAEGDVEAYATALDLLIRDDPLRDRLGRAAQDIIRNERSLAVAADILDLGLTRALAMAACA